MRLGDLLKDIEIIETDADMEMDIAGISSDSSTIRPGELFVAIEGYKTDGHKYIKDAQAKGAACVISQHRPDVEIPFVKTDDSRIAFALVCAAWFGHPTKKLKLVGVTGTNGKTSVTYIIKHIIEKCTESKVGLIGTIENLIGERELASRLTTPDSYEFQLILDKMVFEGCRWAVMEVSSHALELSRVYGVEYEAGVFTNLTPEHMDFHASMDDYAEAKSKLFRNCRSSIVNIDDKYARRMIDSSLGKVMTYAIDNPSADVAAKRIEISPGKTSFEVTVNGTAYPATIHIPGMFSVYNALAAITAGVQLGFEPERITKALFSCPGVRGRAEVLPTGKDFTVLLDYAHKPYALENIIKTARSMTDGRVITLFGCGGDRDKTKRPVMGKTAMELSDIVFITSDNPRTEEPGAIIEEILAGITDAQEMRGKGRLKVIESRNEAICQALDILLLGDVLVIAGKGHETYQILGEKKIHFDDREVVNEYLRKLRGNRRTSFA